MGSARRKVGLVQINNSFSGQNYLPYSVGLFQAYAQKYAKNPDLYEFLLPVYLREPVPATIQRLAGAEIIFFSTYVWNIRISLETARLIKESRPETVIVFGGPQVPDLGDGFLKKYPFIDAACHGEGEQVFLSILEVDPARARARDWGDLPSVSYLKPDGTVVQNKRLERIKDIGTVPSPYLSGVFEPLMKANPNEKWIVLWETNRGCPFSCAFCDWGSATQSRVFKFDEERLFREVDWFAEKKIEFIFCADANFGMLERDLEIAQYVADSKAKKGYPHALSVQNTKNATERAYKVQKLLSDSGLNKGVTIALQSIDPLTLKNIKRSNISSESFQELQRRFTRDKVDTYTDIILGLPGETYASFVDGVSRVIENGQHNRIQFGNLSILPNAEMGNPAYQKEHGMEIVETPVVNFHGSLATTENEILETQELVVATSSLPREEWVRMRAFAWTCSLLYFNKVLQIPLLLLSSQFSIKFRDLITLFTDGDMRDLPILKEIQEFLKAKARDIQKGGAEYCSSEKWLNIWWPADELILINICTEGKLDAFYAEAETALSRYLAASFIQIPKSLLHEAIELNHRLIKLPNQDRDLELKLSYNLWEAYQGARVGEKTPVIERPSTYRIERSAQKWSSWADWCREVIWWGNKKGAYLYSNTVLERELSGHH